MLPPNQYPSYCAGDKVELKAKHERKSEQEAVAHVVG